MNTSDAFHRYTKKVCGQIRWKKAHDIVSREIENHLHDQRDAYMAQGDTESVAEEKALLQMGDAVSVGMALDQTHRPSPQWAMIGLVMLLSGIGAIIQFCYYDNALAAAPAGNISIARFAFALPLGILLFAAAYFLDFSFIGKYPYLLPVALLGIDIVAQLIGVDFNGKNWLSIGRFAISPISLSLPFPLAFCGLLYHFRHKRNGYLLGGLFAAFFCVQLVCFHTMSGLFVFVCAAGSLMLFAAVRGCFPGNTKRLFLLFVVAGIVLFAMFLWANSYYAYRMNTLFAVFRPETDPQNVGYFPLLLRNIMEHSVFWGKGNPLEIADYSAILYSGNFRADFLLTFLSYEYGWGIAMFLVLLLTGFLAFGLHKAFRQKSILGQMVSLSILCTFAGEVFVYILNNLGYPLIAPIALPFLSYGTTALLLHMALAGILLSTFRTGEVFRDKELLTFLKPPLFQWDNGKLIISFKG
ncbi:MAG: FtsW/RodA/SpoVE family cell cycle protein [Anaerotignum sp.]|nr:FtsW/RodA/SpoVE family cell cycle protein [Anaerotignum sp.]